MEQQFRRQLRAEREVRTPRERVPACSPAWTCASTLICFSASLLAAWVACGVSHVQGERAWAWKKKRRKNRAGRTLDYIPPPLSLQAQTYHDIGICGQGGYDSVRVRVVDVGIAGVDGAEHKETVANKHLAGGQGRNGVGDGVGCWCLCLCLLPPL